MTTTNCIACAWADGSFLINNSLPGPAIRFLYIQALYWQLQRGPAGHRQHAVCVCVMTRRDATEISILASIPMPKTNCNCLLGIIHCALLFFEREFWVPCPSVRRPCDASNLSELDNKGMDSLDNFRIMGVHVYLKRIYYLCRRYSQERPPSMYKDMSICLFFEGQYLL